MNINEFVFSNLERYQVSPYEIGDTYGDRVTLCTKNIEFDSMVEYQLVSADTSTGADEKEIGRYTYLRIDNMEWKWTEFENIIHAELALMDILYAIQEHGMSAEEAVRRVFPEAVRVEH